MIALKEQEIRAHMSENQRIALAKADVFVPISGRDEKGNGITYYGGDQAWFGTRVGRISGCGAVAAANLFAYLARNHPDAARLFPVDQEEITVDAFRMFMEEVIRFVAPIKVPFMDMPLLGLPLVSRFAHRCVRFAADRNVHLRAHCHHLEMMDKDSAAALIREQLALDNPPALLNMLNPNLTKIAYTDAHGQPVTTDFQYHWVIITSIGTVDGRTAIDVSSEGAKARLFIDDVCNDGKNTIFGRRGIVHFSLA
jgi:hypothetical protein